MSKELDDRIDAAREDLIRLSTQTVGMSNYKDIRRAYEKIMLTTINVVDAINAEEDKGET